MLNFNEMQNSFKNVALLDRGGQKIVYSAEHPKFGNIVIKLYFKLDSRSEREIEIGKQLKFDCVPILYDTGFVVYEGVDTLYTIEQRILGEVLRHRIERGNRFSLSEAVDFLEQGLTFISQIEEKKIIHRDIKPENIIVSDNKKIYFLDFGIARILGLPSLTKTEAFMGPHTPGYAAPEQFNNLKSNIDSRADLFSIGVVVYECLSGKNPFREGAVSALDILQKTETVTPVTYMIEGDTQQQFMALLSSLMNKYPSRRPKNAKQALSWLNAAKLTFNLERK
jgi:serine/threonine-protein kinase